MLRSAVHIESLQASECSEVLATRVACNGIVATPKLGGLVLYERPYDPGPCWVCRRVGICGNIHLPKAALSISLLLGNEVN